MFFVNRNSFHWKSGTTGGKTGRVLPLFLSGNRKERGMQGIQNRMVTNASQRIKKCIGRTAYEVTLHFSSTSTEKPYDKLKRIILNDCTNLKKSTNNEKVPDKQ